MMNNKRPNIEPYVIPYVIFLSLDSTLSKQTIFDGCIRYSLKPHLLCFSLNLIANMFAFFKLYQGCSLFDYYLAMERVPPCYGLPMDDYNYICE